MLSRESVHLLEYQIECSDIRESGVLILLLANITLHQRPDIRVPDNRQRIFPYQAQHPNGIVEQDALRYFEEENTPNNN